MGEAQRREKVKTIITGPFGSGKSEIALQLALNAARDGQKAALVDMDIVNPYFTSGQHKALLEASGVAVAQPSYGGSGIDLPSLSGDIRRWLTDEKSSVFVDMGGDPIGATALGSLSGLIKDYQMLFVYNPLRPMVARPEAAWDMLREIETRARLKITGLIYNANLAAGSSGQELADSQPQMLALVQLSGLPVIYHCGGSEALAAYRPEGLFGQGLLLELRNHPAWLRPEML